MKNDCGLNNPEIRNKLCTSILIKIGKYKACLLIEKIMYVLLVPFSDGRHEGANPSSRVTELPDLEFSNQFCRPFILF